MLTLFHLTLLLQEEDILRRLNRNLKQITMTTTL
jgi:hypothetical protein